MIAVRNPSAVAGRTLPRSFHPDALALACVAALLGLAPGCSRAQLAAPFPGGAASDVGGGASAFNPASAVFDAGGATLPSSAGSVSSAAQPSVPGRLGTFVQPAVTARETYTDNANFGYGGPAQGDWISEVIPSLTVQSVTPRLQLSGSMQFDAINYLHHTLPSMVLPNGGFDGILTAIPNHLFLDAGVTAVQSPNDLLLPSNPGTSTFNTFTTYDYHVSPDFRGQLPAEMQYDLRSDNSWSHSVNVPVGFLDNTYLGHDSAELSKKPQSLGFSLKVEQFDNSFGGATGESTRQQIGRLILRAALDPQFIVGLRGGAERENFLPGYSWHSIRGAEFDWKPTDRTDISAYGERRFFGNGFQYSVHHRTPWFALNFSGGRDISTTPQELFSLPATGNVAGLLDAMLMTQYPDPAARAQAVQSLMTNENLPNSMASPSLLFAPLVYLSESNTATAVWTGRRSAISFSVFELRSQVLAGTTFSTALPAASLFEGSNVQRGASIDANRHISPLTSLALTVTGSRVEGIGSAAGFSMSQTATTLRAIRQLSPRTDFTVGVRNQQFSSPLLPSGREKAVFVALDHRFGR
jgi:uncharacterized protein, PEP-CTERM system associated